MKILIDNNLPPALSRSINALAEKSEYYEATSILDLYGTGKVSDEKWLLELTKNQIIAVITQDYFDKTPQEIAAYQKAKVPFFYLANKYNRLDLWNKCARLILKWPFVCQQVRAVKKEYAEFEVPGDWGQQLKQLRRKRR
jgi:hypothetical protein